MKEKKRINKRIVIESVMTLFIALSPLIAYSYKYFPNDTESINLFFFDISKNGFSDARTAYWYYLNKTIPLLFLVIWFVTSKSWWYHAILIPIAMYSFQFYTVLTSEDTTKADENEIFYVLAVSMVVIPIVYFIRIKLVDKYIHGIDLKAMDTELQIIKAKQELREEREKLEQVKDTLSKKM